MYGLLIAIHVEIVFLRSNAFCMFDLHCHCELWLAGNACPYQWPSISIDHNNNDNNNNSWTTRKRKHDKMTHLKFKIQLFDSVVIRSYQSKPIRMKIDNMEQRGNLTLSMKNRMVKKPTSQKMNQVMDGNFFCMQKNYPSCTMVVCIAAIAFIAAIHCRHWKLFSLLFTCLDSWWLSIFFPYTQCLHFSVFHRVCKISLSTTTAMSIIQCKTNDMIWFVDKYFINCK